MSIYFDPDGRRASTYAFIWPLETGSYELWGQLSSGSVRKRTMSRPGGISVIRALDSDLHELWRDGIMLLEPRRGPQRANCYSPMENRRILRNFSKITDREGALRFAQKYGLLGRIQFDEYFADVDGKRVAEPLSFWLKHSLTVRALSYLLDLERTSTEQDARQHLRGMPSPIGPVDLKPLVERSLNGDSRCAPMTYAVLPNAALYVRQFTRYLRKEDADPDLIEPLGFKYLAWAKAVFIDVLNFELQAGASPALSGRPGQGLQVIPIDLLGAIYVLLAEEATQYLPSRISCPGCHRWFTPTNARHRVCTPTCGARVRRAIERQGR